MRSYVLITQTPLAAGKLIALLFLFLSMTVASREAVSAPAGGPSAAALKRDADRCRTTANVEVCYDAIRWNPSDPSLLVSLGDALTHAKRPADALRAYRRAQTLAPDTRGLTAKISAIEAKLSPKRAAKTAPAVKAAPAAKNLPAPNTAPIHVVTPPVPAVASQASGAKRYSNAAQDTQSH